MPPTPPFHFLADIRKFRHASTRYYGENALVLAECSRLAYENRFIIREKLLRNWRFKNVRYFSHQGSQAFLAANNQFMIAAFRGTEPRRLRDWSTDSKVRLVPGPGGRVHEGFQRALRRVWKDRPGAKGIRSSIDEFRDNHQSLWFCGHSLGGAMAVLAVAGLVINEGVDVSGLYTMGQPRTGDKRFARKYNSLFRSRTFRFINNNDLVTRLPPRVLKYRHIGEVIYLDHRGRLRSGLSRWREFLDRVRGFMVDVGELGPDAINDHFIRDYVRVIRKNRRVRPRNL